MPASEDANRGSNPLGHGLPELREINDFADDVDQRGSVVMCHGR